MINVEGKFSSAKIFANNVEEGVIEQVRNLCDLPFTKGSKVRIMPDTHVGVGCVIGFTADLGNKVIPNIVGVDIGCGMLTVKLGDEEFDLAELDEIIKKYVPSGKNTHHGRYVRYDKLKELKCFRDLKNTKRLERSIGTLGGGNHFIEIAVGKDGDKYLVIHSGSRNLGKQVAGIYQSIAVDMCSGKEGYYKERERLIVEYKANGRRKELQGVLKELKKKYDDQQPEYPKSLCYLTGEYKDRYLHDMKICQEYANLNRETMADIILNKLLEKGIEEFEYFNTIHNYINFKDNIIRKGSVSAYEGETLLIPINMRDGSLLCVGKGNEDWNYSAPHGAGRILSRTAAKEAVSLEEFQESMKGIYTTSVTKHTVDEAPMAYKPMKEIVDNIQDTVDIIDIIKPIYNFKSQ